MKTFPFDRKRNHFIRWSFFKSKFYRRPLEILFGSIVTRVDQESIHHSLPGRQAMLPAFECYLHSGYLQWAISIISVCIRSTCQKWSDRASKHLPAFLVTYNCKLEVSNLIDVKKKGEDTDLWFKLSGWLEIPWWKFVKFHSSHW